MHNDKHLSKHIVTNESFATVHTTRTAYTEGETSAVCKEVYCVAQFLGLSDDINCTIIFIKLILMIISEKSLLQCDRVTYNEVHVI